MPSNPSRTTILDDLPAGKDALDFQPYIDTLADILSSPNTRTPLTIGVFGTWGSGKTSLMRLVQKGLPGSYRTAWFDAWKYDKETTLWRALLLTVLTALREAIPKNNRSSLKELVDLETSLYQTIDREEVGNLQINWGKVAEGVGQGVIQIGLSFLPGVSTLTKMVEELQKDGATTATTKLVEALERERSKIHIEQVQFLDQFQKRFKELTDKHIVQKNLRLVVFIDDLDRCLPEKAVEVLEAIKLFLDVEGCAFVLGLDHEVIARGIEIKYKELGFDPKTEADRQRFAIDGTRYLEKIIQLPFQIPPIERTEMQDFVTGLVQTWPHKECARVFAEGLGGNPRQVKRTVNVFLLLSGLAERRKQEAHPVRLAKIVAIQNALPRLYDFLKDDRHHLLRDLEAYYLIERTSSEATLKSDHGGIPVKDRPELSEALVPFLAQRGIAAVRRVLAMHPNEPDFNFSSLTPDAIRAYFTLTRQAEAPVVHPVAPPRADFEPQMIRIPAGIFVMGTNDEQAKHLKALGMQEEYIQWQQPQHQVELSEYWIGKFPITNREYQFFVREAGHKPPHHWDGDQYPEGQGEHPVVYVSWSDASAYCQWLTGKVGDKTKIYRLSTEAEWEKAARGTDGRMYPWGNEWAAGKCNSEDAGIGSTTPVGQYSPAGDSPFGCADMAGNVWEWCSDFWNEKEYVQRAGKKVKDPQGPEKGSLLYVCRGGYYGSDQTWPACASRVWDGGSISVNLGFRVAASPASL
ncbi:MAG: SUMF1/EgtB/PvdO family nonheme iron enzyme [Anaerolineales bacterium]|nr:SUMF1/EgtB/PvdO family nonheme iron enzyme [Anaerolineales bacterium]